MAASTPPARTLLAIGTRKGLWLARSDDGRQTWSLDGPHFLAAEIPAVAIDTRGGRTRVLAGIDSSHWGPTVTWSDDLGAHWDETEHGGVRFPDGTGAALARVWQIQPDAESRPDVVWAGCEPHSLWRSEDGGRSFSLVRGLWDHPHRPQWTPGGGGATVHTVLPDPTSDRVVVAMSTGGVYVSDDANAPANASTDDPAREPAGGTWRPANRGITAPFLPDPEAEFGQCVHKVAVDASGHSRLYAQHHHGVYRSDDGAASWTPIDAGLPADFGFVMLAHPRVPGTAWVVPLQADARRVPPDGRLRVHVTRDAGESWKEQGVGLPDGCWVTVLRDAACLDTADPVGVYVGTRDGCVYASADEGDSFRTVAAHLPDVLSVRAAALP